MHGLEDRRPVLIHNSDRQPHVADCGLTFDRILAYSVLQHVDHGLKEVILRDMVRHLKPGGILTITHMLPFTREVLLSRFGLRVVHSEKVQCNWVQSDTQWWDLQA